MIWWHGLSSLLWNLLTQTLMRSGLVKVLDIRIEYAVELLLLDDE